MRRALGCLSGSSVPSQRFAEQIASVGRTRLEAGHADATGPTGAADCVEDRRTRDVGAVGALRARLVLRCATGETAAAVGREEHVTKQIVGKWRARFLT